MNTATISPALDMLANKPANAQASKTPEADNDSPRFADVLSQQHASQAPETGKRVDNDSASKDSTSGSDARPETDQLDSELSRLTAQSGVAGQPLPLLLDHADQAIAFSADPRGDTRQLREPGIAVAHARQVLPSDAKVDVDYAQLRPGTATPISPAESSATLAALMNPANATTNSVRRAQSDTTSLHQTLSASAKAKNPASVPGNAALITDATKAVDLSTGKIAISEFSTAMIDAANLARARMSGNNAPDAAITASTNDHVASLASQILPSGPTNSTAASALGVPVPLNSPQWGTDFGRQFVSMLQNGTNGTQVAELRLDPPELGPLRITLNLSDNVAHAAFFSPHAAVRQTVENALPQLQELLAQAGISLGDTSVNDQSQTAQDFSESRNQGQASGQGRSTDSSLLVATSDSAPAARSRSPDALVDTFA